MVNKDNDELVGNENITKQDDDEYVKQEKCYYKAKFMLDWVNKFSCTDCVHPGVTISID